MKLSIKKPRSLYTISIILNIALSAECLLLVQQNRELKISQSSLTIMQEPEQLTHGERIGSVRLITLDGSDKELAYGDRRTKRLMFILSTTCPHCEKNLANWNAITESIRSNECEIIGVSLDATSETKKYIEGRNVGFYIASIADADFSRKFKISGVPTTILINGDGRVEKVWIGELSEAAVAEIKKLVDA